LERIRSKSRRKHLGNAFVQALDGLKEKHRSKNKGAYSDNPTNMSESNRDPQRKRSQKLTLSWLAKQRPRINSARVSESNTSLQGSEMANIKINGVDKNKPGALSGLFASVGNTNNECIDDGMSSGDNNEKRSSSEIDLVSENDGNTSSNVSQNAKQLHLDLKIPIRKQSNLKDELPDSKHEHLETPKNKSGSRSKNKKFNKIDLSSVNEEQSHDMKHQKNKKNKKDKIKHVPKINILTSSPPKADLFKVSI
jgi:hypothetical protein